MSKTEILGPVISDFLKYEATPQTRVAVAADAGTKQASLSRPGCAAKSCLR